MDPEEKAVSHAMLERDVKDLALKVEQLTKQVEGLVAAWNTAQGVVVFVKWAAKLALGLGVLWGAVKGLVAWKL